MGIEIIPITRIIPTRVGTRGYASSHGDPEKDHPHACGDKLRRYSVQMSILGSSPRVWGQVEQLRKSEQPDRIIPTRVGTSFSYL